MLPFHFSPHQAIIPLNITEKTKPQIINMPSNTATIQVPKTEFNSYCVVM